MEKSPVPTNQIISRSNFEVIPAGMKRPVGLRNWIEWYLHDWTTTSEATRKVQRRDLYLFLDFMLATEKTDAQFRWTPRLSEEFRGFLITTKKSDGSRRWGDRSMNRILASLKTFAKWLHGLQPFPLGNPMQKIHATPIANPLIIERALTDSERRGILDAADSLLTIGGRSKSRRRHTGKDITDRPVRKGYRPWRNRAIIYALIETGMRRNAIVNLNINDIDYRKKEITVMEKGRITHTYPISTAGLKAIADYVEAERAKDEAWGSPALFLASSTNRKGDGRLSVRMVNFIWNEICRWANVQGKTPHSARHAMGRWIMQAKGNVAAVQRQLGHQNAAYSMLYARITSEELQEVLDERNQPAK